jgi:alkylation response protein AidB-like acyl-CoA dehydrogenase
MDNAVTYDDTELSQDYLRLSLLAHRFESSFGGEARNENLLSTSCSLGLDFKATFPTAACAALDRWGMPDYYVPAWFDGRWNGSDELMLLLRLIARRDLTVAIAHAKTFLGSVSVWIGGSRQHGRRLGDEVRQGAIVSLGLTERAHGSDISASDTIALRTQDGYILSGEKYLINNATRCDLITVFTRTGFTRSARDFSLLLVDKRTLPADAFHATPKQQTHGIRGADISGIVFANTPLDHAALVGAEGSGLECVLKGFQITRTLCAGLSAGGADRALRTALGFAADRQVAGRTLDTLPLIRAILTEACADMLIVDILAQTGARAINVMPQRMSLVSAIVKAEVPDRAERMVEAVGEVLGARAYLEHGGGYDGFAKVQRDIRLVAIFDGNTTVNLHALRLQIKELSRRRRAGATASPPELMTALFDLDAPLPALRPEALSLACHGGDPVVGGLDDAMALLLRGNLVTGSVQVRLHTNLLALLAERQALETEALEAPLDVRRLMPQDFELARRYSRLFAAACCVRMFLHNHAHLADELSDGAWLADVLDRLAGTAIPDGTGLLAALKAQCRKRQMFGVRPVDLAPADAPETGVS